jgi:simple sugar transport system ATP-binding protein
MAAPAFIEFDGLSKAFAGVQALSGVSFTIPAGAAVSLAGENGSGKSTLIKILAGVERADAGAVRVDGRPLAPDPRAAAKAGVQVIFQDFSLFPNLTVAENVAFSELLAERRRLYPRARAREIATRALARLGVAIDPDARVEALPVAHKQLVAIARALSAEARLVVMDEPTTALTEREVRTLLDIIRRLKAEGVAVLFVSHKLAEVLEVCEHVVVLRNGRKVAEGPAPAFDAAALTRHMTGRDVVPTAPDPLDPATPVRLAVEGLTKAGAFEDVSLSVRAGEVVGVAGLLGSGRTALAKALFGLVRPDRGRILLDGREAPLGDPIAAAAAGVAYVPEDRLTEGLFLAQPIRRNVAVGRLDAHARGGLLDLGALWGEAQDWLGRLRVAAPDIGLPVRALSGGNQQRVVLARWLARGPKVLVLNGPTVGVDVGSKAEIHAIVADLARQGLGVLVISDDLPELLETCHRILVMKAGRLVEEIAGAEADEAGLARRLAS